MLVLKEDQKEHIKGTTIIKHPTSTKLWKAVRATAIYSVRRWERNCGELNRFLSASTAEPKGLDKTCLETGLVYDKALQWEEVRL